MTESGDFLKQSPLKIEKFDAGFCSSSSSKATSLATSKSRFLPLFCYFEDVFFGRLRQLLRSCVCWTVKCISVVCTSSIHGVSDSYDA